MARCSITRSPGSMSSCKEGDMNEMFSLKAGNNICLWALTEGRKEGSTELGLCATLLAPSSLDKFLIHYS